MGWKGSDWQQRSTYNLPVRTLLDVAIFIAVLVALMFTFFIGDGWSFTNPLSWLTAASGAYAFHRLLKLIYSAKPRWQIERERDDQLKSNPSAN